ncbi:MAG: putative DNA binding domain-containing protein [Candidatus Cloacimonetes bacterium]|nr:putative DNA binding domain-containing protein [Candidatus Cloacimonadota bacterium]
MKSKSQTLDYKEEINDAVFQTISAFANTKGGEIIVGISNKEEGKGLEISNQEVDDFTNRVVRLMGIHPEMKLSEIDNQTILKIDVRKSHQPISFLGKYYKRVGITNRLMKDDELRDFFIKGVNWDSYSDEYSYDEIDEVSIRKFLKLAIYNGRLSSASEQENPKNILEKLKLIDSGKITNAAIILFGKNPQKHFINAIVRIGRFKDQATIIGDKKIDGNLFRIAEEAENTIKQFINVRYEIKDSFQRKEIWDYPLTAIREALFNAIIHRDYFKSNIQTQIKIFDNFIWFYNPGVLPEGLTIEKLRSVHPSIARNPLIMNVFYLAGFVEEYGSGFERIKNAFREQELPEPKISSDNSGFTLQFNKKEETKEFPEITGLNERQKKAVYYLRKNGRISNKIYQEINKTTRETAKRDLAGMVEKGFLLRIGDGRSISYVSKK